MTTEDESRVELYDLNADLAEEKDQAKNKPEVVKGMLALLKDWKATLPEKPTGDVFSAERKKK